MRPLPGRAHAWYCVGIDWAQQRDYTVAAVLRCDVTPLQLVAIYRTQRRPWPEMTERVGALLDAFPGPAAHDATGAGSAIGAFLALKGRRQLTDVTLVGRVRTGSVPQLCRLGRRSARRIWAKWKKDEHQTWAFRATCKDHGD